MIAQDRTRLIGRLNFPNTMQEPFTSLDLGIKLKYFRGNDFYRLFLIDIRTPVNYL